MLEKFLDSIESLADSTSYDGPGLSCSMPNDSRKDDANMKPKTTGNEVVVTGSGVISPIGIGCEAFWESLCLQRSGVSEAKHFSGSAMPVKLVAQVADFDAKKYIRPRKSLKVMSRDIQLGFAAADMAFSNAGIKAGNVDPERVGVVFGADMIYSDLDELVEAYSSCRLNGEFDFRQWGTRAMDNIFPLWMLKYLPNMPACHIAIAHDARGPNNSITLSEVSSLLAIAEGAEVIHRGQADVMVVGGASCRLHPMRILSAGDSNLSHYHKDPAIASRPFDALRDGTVAGEGAAAFVLERRSYAQARGAKIIARVVGYASTFEPRSGNSSLKGNAIRSAISIALASAGLEPRNVGHVNAHGLSTIEEDRIEAQAIRDTLGDVPVTAPKSFFGNLGAGTGAVEMLVSLLALQKGQLPVTLNYQNPDPECPIRVVHGVAMPVEKPTAVILNQTTTGQSAAIVIAGE